MPGCMNFGISFMHPGIFRGIRIIMSVSYYAFTSNPATPAPILTDIPDITDCVTLLTPFPVAEMLCSSAFFSFAFLSAFSLAILPSGSFIYFFKKTPDTVTVVGISDIDVFPVFM